MTRKLTFLLLLIALLLPAVAGADTRAGEPVYFNQTGHTLGYSFRAFWQERGGLPIFGYPLSEVFLEEGLPVQYFERTRLEWHALGGLVLAGHLGRWAATHLAGHPAFAPVGGGGPAQDYFPETRHTLRSDFRSYWWSNGGLQVFGFPLSEEFREVNPQDGHEYTVQYFERARFELHPEAPARYRVQLGHLGRQYVEALQPVPGWALERVKGAQQAWDGVRPSRVRIARIKLDTEVVEGGFSLGVWDVPRYTAIHYWPVAAYPETRGNIVIAGHVGYRNIIFNQLPQARVGDEVVVSTAHGERRYLVSDIWTLEPQDAWVMGPTLQETLTLITCVPIGIYSHRLIVRALPVAA